MRHKFQSSYQQRREHDWTRGFFFFVECGDVVFNISKDTEVIAERVRRFSHWFCLFVFWCPCQRGFADCDCEDGTVRRHLARDCGRALKLERRGVVAHKGPVIVFLILFQKYLTTSFSCHACVTVVQHASEKVVDRSSKICSAIEWAWPGAVPCHNQAQRMRLPSL